MKFFNNKKGFDPAGNVSLVIMIVVMIAIIFIISFFMKSDQDKIEFVITPLRNDYFAQQNLRTFLQSNIRYEGKDITIGEFFSEYYIKILSNSKAANEMFKLYSIQEYALNYFYDECFELKMVKAKQPYTNMELAQIITMKIKIDYPKYCDFNSSVYQILPIYDYLDGQKIYVYFNSGTMKLR
jgi:hypothetical protein